MARYFLKAGGIKENKALENLIENFVDIEMVRRNWNMKLSVISPIFVLIRLKKLIFW